MMFRKSVVDLSVASALLVMAGSAAASGFALIEQSGSGLGNAFAGGAASAEDASTIFFNPAGMSRLSGKQVVVVAHAITPSAKFSDSGTSATAGAFAKNGNGGDAGGLALVPNGFFVMDINPQARFGLGISAPFGLQTQYDANWIGRFQAIKSKIETININPSLSYQVNDAFSIGAGVNYQRIKAELTNAAVVGPTEGVTTMTGSDAAWGYNLGALMHPDENARIGISYRSAIQYKLSGTAYTASVLNIPGTTNTFIPITADIKTPDMLSLSYFRSLNSSWDVMVDLTRTGWSNFKELRVIRVSTGATSALTQENWRDTWRAAVGANYHYNDQWLTRVGVAYDQSPVPDAFRTARIPDQNRTWLSLGGQYKPTKDSAVDVGYSHLFVSSASINNNKGGVNVASTAAYGNLVGNYNNSVDILSVQYAHSF